MLIIDIFIYILIYFQKVVLGYECLEHENLPSIVLSIVGVPPQHNAPNRNEFIKIHEDNILPGNFHCHF